MTGEKAGWLSAMPRAWGLVPAKAAFRERREPNLPNDVHLTPSQTLGVLPQTDYMTRTGSAVVQNIQGQDNMKHVEPDDFIIHLRSFQGGIERSTFAGKVSTAYCVLQPTESIVPDYFRWLLKSDGYIQELRTTTNQLRDGQSIKFRDFARIPLPVPSLDDQRAIADYLDRETARIDTLIAEQRRLIEMLRERRTAVIDHALHLDVPMIRLGALASFHNGDRGISYPSRDEFVHEGVPFVNAGHLVAGSVDMGNMNFVTYEKYGSMGGAKLRKDDLLFCLRGSLGKYGRFPWHGGALASSLVAMRLADDRVLTSFIFWVLGSTRFQEQVSLGETGSAQPNLSVDQLRQFRVPVPDVRQQDRTAVALDEETNKIDVIIAETERFIELSRERRAALITAAVTGQIDVREVA